MIDAGPPVKVAGRFTRKTDGTGMVWSSPCFIEKVEDLVCVSELVHSEQFRQGRVFTKV